MDPRDQIKDYRNQLAKKDDEINAAKKRINELEYQLEDIQYELRQHKSIGSDSKDSSNLQQAKTKIAQLENEIAQKKTTEDMTGNVTIKQEPGKPQHELLESSNHAFLNQRTDSLSNLLTQHEAFFAAYVSATGIKIKDVIPTTLHLQQQSAAAAQVAKQLENEKGIAEARGKTIRNYEGMIKKRDGEIEKWKAKAVELQKGLDAAVRKRVEAETKLKRVEISRAVDAGRDPFSSSVTAKSKIGGTAVKDGRPIEKRKWGSMQEDNDEEDNEDDEEPLMRKWKGKRDSGIGEGGRLG